MILALEILTFAPIYTCALRITPASMIAPASMTQSGPIEAVLSIDAESSQIAEPCMP